MNPAPDPKIETLLEAIPYIKKWQNQDMVIKIGGELIDDQEALKRIAGDIALLRLMGLRLVIVHGGGSQVTALSQRLGFEPQIIEGRRITDQDSLEAAKMVLAGKSNIELVAALRAADVPGVGLSAVSSNLIVAKRRPKMQVKDKESGQNQEIDYGFVGDIESVDPQLLVDLCDGGHVPVVSCLAADKQGQILNINADTVACQIAMALPAHKLIMMTNAPGLLRDPDQPDSLISHCTPKLAAELSAQGVIKDGMAPKLKNALDTVAQGVKHVHMINGFLEHALLLELLTDAGIGTMFMPDSEEPA